MGWTSRAGCTARPLRTWPPSTRSRLFDSDTDGFSNITEINARSFPGNSSSTPALVTLTVQKQGSGGGTVTGDGINCGPTCSVQVLPGKNISLSAAANGNSTFAGWAGGGCSGAGGCNVTVNVNTTVTASFTLKPVTLTVQKQGLGGGTVSGGGINCGPTCAMPLTAGANVSLSAAANGDSDFAGWSGGGCSGAGGCNVTVNADTTVIATFNLKPVTLTVQKQGSGSGTVSGGGIDCGGICAVNVTPGASVSLGAVPSAGSTFVSWSGGGCSGNGACNVTVTANTTVTATFNTTPLPVLTVQKQGSGAGTVTGGPISCGSTCSAPVSVGSQVTLSAAASAGSIFAGWSGGGCSGTGACSVTVNSSTTVTATFNGAAATQLVAAVLPTSRSVQVNTLATAFVTIINTGAQPAFAVGIGLDPAGGIPAAFGFQTTDPATNQLTGSLNAAVDIPVGGRQTFVIGLVPTAAFGPTEVRFAFAGANTAPVAPIVGVNTLLLSASSTPVPDIVALAATVSRDGIVSIPGATRVAAFAVASVNVGIAGTLTVSPDTGGAAPPVTLSICQTDPGTSVCLQPPAASVGAVIAAGATPTFGVFIIAHGDVPFDPAAVRVFVRFSEGGVVRGATSVAIQTK